MSLTNVKEGLSAIAAEVLEDVRKESETLILNAQAEAKEALRTGKDEADKAYARIMKEAQIKAEVEKRKIQSQTDVEVRNRLLQIKEKLVDTTFEKASAKLGEFTKTEEYHDYLENFIVEAAKKIGSKDLIIRVNAADRAWMESSALADLSKKLHTDLELADEIEDCMGGCKIQTADGKVIYDNTLENRLRQLKPELRVKAAKILFAQEELTDTS
jgi:vacuolar-type H+-ATPase subunit E/Vma4